MTATLSHVAASNATVVKMVKVINTITSKSCLSLAVFEIIFPDFFGFFFFKKRVGGCGDGFWAVLANLSVTDQTEQFFFSDKVHV